jgi:hypothetical protein
VFCAGLGVVLPALSVGCSKGDRRLKDTEGRVYTAACSEDGCKIQGPPSNKGSIEYTLETSGRIVGICEADQRSQAKRADRCRPLVCDTDDACPPAHGLEHGACVNRLCTEPANATAVADAVMLCLAGTGWGQGSAAQVERYALALNCGSPCQIPAPCRR